LALNVLQITILNFDAVALTEGTPSSAFVSGLVLVLGTKNVDGGPNLAAVIEAGRMYVTPTPQSRDRFLKRVQPILHAFDAYPQTKGVL
jgi:hypothetical protein